MTTYSLKHMLTLYIITFIPLVTCQNCGLPTDCVVSEWNQWSDCTQSCGEHGSRTRTRVVFQNSQCGGICPFDIQETENCNRKCCPVDCTFTHWSSWKSCECTDDGCNGEGKRFKCTRKRRKLSDATCGGYCDEQTKNVRCGYLCCYRDCVLGRWTDWSECDAPCEQFGTTRRTREIIQNAACGGKPCQNKEEINSCKGKCCPVDCVLGEWSGWSKCGNTCGEATQTRERHVQLPVCGGEACTEEPVTRETKTCTNYVNVDCQLSSWTAWSECYLDNGFCGDGTNSRARYVIIQPSCKGQTCGHLTETIPCNGPCCRRDCKVTDWSDLGYCSSQCGQGMSKRTRSIEMWPSCGGTLCPANLVESRGCLVTEVLNCTFTEWGDWTTCSNSCGNGVSARNREMIYPAYCGGECQNDITYDERACESHSAKRNCEVTEWGKWSECFRSCEGGVQHRNRTVIAVALCGGVSCPNLTETMSCHESCEQICQNGTCDCKPGYLLNADNVTCSMITCVRPEIRYCPSTHRLYNDCKYPMFSCSMGYTFNQTCDAYCLNSDWKLTGSPTSITCMADGSWTNTSIFCARPNHPPLGITIDKTEINKYTPKDTCFAVLKTLVSNQETYEFHTYNITSDETGRFYIHEDTVCLSRMAEYSEKPDRWNVTFRSSDIAGEFAEETFSFAILDANSPPASVQLNPNTIPENSPAGTIVGCFVGTDYDTEQTLTFTLINSLQKLFSSFQENGQTCLKVTQESGTRCSTDGGTHCVLNMEEQFEHQVTVRVTDDGIPPMSALFEVAVYLSDVNDRQTAVKVIPDKLPENVPAGQKLVKLVTVDEDVGQLYTYRIVNDASGLFSVEEDYLIASRTFDYEKEPDLLLEIEVESTDDDTPPFTIVSVIKLKLQDVNEAPFDLQLSSVDGVNSFSTNRPRVPENIKGLLGTVTVKEQDANEMIEISFGDGKKFSGNLNLSHTSCININSQMFCKATITIKSSYDYEVDLHQNISIVATDSADNKAFVNTSLEILDMNDPPSNLLVNGLNQLEIEVPENKMNYRVGDLSATDDDTQDTHIFKLVQSTNDMFLLEGNILKTSKTETIDFERQEMYNLVISITDNGKPRKTSNFDVVVKILDTNEQPTETMLSNKKVVENSPEGTIVGELTTRDPDNYVTEKQHFKYTLSDDSYGRFQLNGNILETRRSTQLCGVNQCVLDYETEKHNVIKVITLDDGEPVMQREDRFTIEIEDANDPPTDIRIDRNVVYENDPPGTIIGTIHARDDDGNTITISYQNYGDVFEIKDNKLVTKTELNFERLNNYLLEVLAKDNGVPQGENKASVVIEVLDVNEKPVFVNVSTSLTVREDVNFGDIVVTYAISDPDSIEDVAVSLIDNSDTLSISSPFCRLTPLSGATDCTVNLILMKLLDATKIKTVNISIIVSDKAGLTATEDIVVKVLDVNIRPTDILLNGMSTDEILVQENSMNTVIANMSAADRDHGQIHTFAIISDNDTQFQIDDSMLKTQPNAILDFETMAHEHNLTVEVYDSGDPPLSLRKTFTIILEDVNEEPSSIILSSNQIAENSVNGTFIGNINITDPDRKQSHTLKLLNDGHGRFLLEGNMLQVGDVGTMCTKDKRRRCKLNYEKQSTYNLTVEVADAGTPPLVALFNVIINITDVNDKPIGINISENTIRLDSSTDTLIGYLYAEDEDINQTHEFEVVDESQFVKVNRTGFVILKDNQNLNEGEIVTIKVKVTDNGFPSLSTEDTIKLVTVGTNMLVVTIEAVLETVLLGTNSIQVGENVPSGDVFAKLVVIFPIEDQDITTALILGKENISVGSASCENVDGKTICLHEMTLNRPLNYEELDRIDVTFETTANQARSIDSFQIYVQDENEAPTSISFDNGEITVNENSRNQFLGMFVVSDEDMEDTHAFTSSENDNFVVTKDGKLLTSADADIDFESVKYLTISVTVIDSGLLSFTKTFNVTVLDVNELPTKLTISNDKIPEMSPGGTEVGSLVVSDPDFYQNHSYMLLSQNESHLFTIDGSKLLVANISLQCKAEVPSHCMLDFERQSEYSLTLRVIDYGQPELTATFVINVQVTNVNDVPRSLSISANKVAEDTDIETIVTVLNAFDDDIGQTLAYSIGDSDYFNIEQENVVLTNKLDYETANEHNISIFVKDDGDQPSTATAEFIIEVIDVNEPPLNMLLSSTGSSVEQFQGNTPAILEHLPALTYIGQIVVLDPDKSDKLRINSITSDIVVINVKCIPLSKGTRCTADMRSGRTFNFEEDETTPISIVAIDDGGLSILLEMTLTVIDSNNAPTNIFLNDTDTSELIVPENSRNVLLAKLSVEDTEEDQHHTYILSGESSLLLISGDELWIASAAVLDYEKTETIHFSINVTDDGSPLGHFEKDIILKITDVNEPPTGLYITQTKIPETADEGYKVGKFIVKDQDNLNDITQEFTFALQNDTSLLKIENDVLLVAASMFDYEKNKVLDEVVIVTDDGVPKMSSTFTLSFEISDVNEAPTHLKFHGNTSVSETIEVGEIIGTLTARDPDEDQILTFSILETTQLSVDGHNVVVEGPLDYESMKEITFTAMVIDNGVPNLKFKRIFTLSIDDVNEKPTDIIILDNQYMEIYEGSPTDSPIEKIKIYDPDGIERLEAEVVYGTETFKLVPATPICSKAKDNYFSGTVCETSIIQKRALDFESDPAFIDVSIKVRDKGGLSIQRTFTFTLFDLDEPPKDIILDYVTEFVPENTPGYVVGTLSTLNDDSNDDSFRNYNDAYRYVVVSDWETFTVVGNKLIVKSSLDYETQKQYTVSVRSQETSDYPEFFIKDFAITVGDVNEEPSIIELLPTQIARDAKVGDIIAKIRVRDPDNEGRPKFQNHTCEVLSPEQCGIDTTASFIKLIAPLSSDKKYYRFRIRCTDTGDPALSLENTFDVSVVENVVFPRDIQVIDQHGNEDIFVNETLENIVVGTISVVNALTNEVVENKAEFSLSETSLKYFSIEDKTLILMKALDFETQPTFDLEMFCKGIETSGDSFELDRRFIINVKDVNEPPSHIYIYGKKAVKENSNTGTFVGNLTTVDSDNYQNYTYKLLGVNYGLSVMDTDVEMLNAFAVDGVILKVGQEYQYINYEKSSVLSLLIRSMDSGEPPYNITSIIHLLVEDGIDPPTDITLSHSEIPENSPVNTIVGKLSIVDEDENSQHYCEIRNLIEVPFKVLADFSLVVAIDILDFETKMTYNVKVYCGEMLEDGTSLGLMKEIVVNITNVNEGPKDIFLSKERLQENNVKGQVVAEIIAVDLDSKNITLSIENAGGSDYFMIQDKNKLVANIVLDYESTVFYTIVIKAEDEEGESTLKTFELEVLDINEAPTKILLDNLVISESTEPGSTLGRLTTEDPDRYQEFKYILENQNGSFRIDNDKLIVGVKGLDFETTPFINISVIATDDGNPPMAIKQEFTIQILDANDPPEAIIIDSLEDIQENTALNTMITTFTIVDQDAGQKHACKVIKGEDRIFVTTEGNGAHKIVIGNKLDYEENNKLHASISCTDGEFDIRKDLDIPIIDVNEAPTSTKLSGSNTVLATAPINHVIGVVTVEDEDINQSHLLALSGEDSDILKISASNELILTNEIPANLINKVDASITFTISAEDNGIPVLTYNHTFNLPLTDVEIEYEGLPNVEISFIKLDYTNEKGDEIGRIYSAGLNLSSSIQFSIVKNPYDMFDLQNNTMLVLAKSIESIEESSLELRIQVEDVETLEKETKKVKVSIRKYKDCLLAEHTCKENENCIEKETLNVCDCIADFSRNFADLCTKIDDCEIDAELDNVASHRCQNGGTCIDGINSYSCSCTKSFEGLHCENEKPGLDECSVNTCLNNGACVREINASLYHCSCDVGWTGTLCDVSVDDCKTYSCRNGGTCLDDHLTFLCECDNNWKGLRCEYNSEICIEKDCHISHVCVGFTNSNRTVCIERGKFIVRLEYIKLTNVSIRSFQARMADFIVVNRKLGLRFDQHERQKREETIVEELQIYVTETEEIDGQFVINFVLIDRYAEPLTKIDALTILSQICQNISKGDVKEELFCPSIIKAYTDISRKQTRRSSGSTTGAIIGIIFGILFLFALTGFIVWILKKKKLSSVKPMNSNQSGEETSEIDYASMPSQSRISSYREPNLTTDNPISALTVETNVIQVAPAPDGQIHESVV